MLQSSSINIAYNVLVGSTFNVATVTSALGTCGAALTTALKGNYPSISVLDPNARLASHQPTSRPSSRPTINIVPPIPRMTAVTVRPTAGNATVTVAFTAAKSFPGAVYCVATLPGNASRPASVSTVVNTGVVMPYASLKDSPVTMVLKNLRAMRTYAVYCAVQLSTGAGSALTEVLSVGKKYFTTTCCKVVTFTTAPPTVFGDVTNYPKGSTNSYVFRYSLSDPPSVGSVTITPVISTVVGSLSPVVAQPASAVFANTSNTAQLGGQFFLVANDSTTGTFQIDLKITGPRASEYGRVKVATTLVQLISGSAPLPAPSVAGAQFGDNGAYILVTFATDTDFAGITANKWPCTTLFNFVGASDVSCVWITKAVVKGQFTKLSGDSTTLLYPGGALSVKGGMIRAACKKGTTCSANKAMPATTVVVQDAATPIEPSVILNLPSSLGACSAMPVDLSMSSGSGGRPWLAVDWSVTATNGDSDPLETALYNKFNPLTNQALVPASTFAAATYSVTAILTNFLNVTGTQTATVAVTADPNLPVVTILGTSVQVVTAVATVKLAGAATLSACATPSSLVYVWSVADAAAPTVPLESLVSTSLDQTKFVLAPYSLKFGHTYTVTLVVQVKSLATGKLLSSGAGTSSVYVDKGPVVAAIRGGASRNAQIDKPFTLDASLSSDENYPVGSASSVLTFTWTCLDTAKLTPCTFSAPTFTTATTNLLTVPANLLAYAGVYNISVIAKSADGRVDSATVVVTGVAPGAPTITTTTKAPKFNSDQVLQITGFISGTAPVNATWTGYFAGAAIPLVGAVTPLRRTFSATEVSSLCSYPVSFPAQFFTPGRTYTFRLTGWPLATPLNKAVADVTITANAPPVGTISPFACLTRISHFLFSPTASVRPQVDTCRSTRTTALRCKPTSSSPRRGGAMMLRTCP